MKLPLSKRWQLTLIYFVPVFVILSIFSGLLIKNQLKQIELFYDTFDEIAYNIEEFDEEEFYDEIISDDEWEQLSDAEIDKKLIAAGEEPIGDPEDPFYHLKPEEVDKVFEEAYQKVYDPKKGKRGGVVFLDPEIRKDVQEFFEEEFEEYEDDEGFEDLPYISVEQIDEIEASFRLESLRNNLIMLLVAMILFAFLAYYFAGKTLQPIEEALEKQKRFVSDASHELRTPLALMKSEAEVLMRVKDSSLQDYQEFSENVVTDVNYLSTLTTNLLQLAKMDQDRKTFAKAETNISMILEKLVKNFQSSAKQKKIEIVNHVAQKDVLLSTNKEGITQVLTILLDNAIKYGKQDGKVEIYLKDENSAVSIEIKDSGLGIAEKDLARVFDRFYRSSEDRNEKGHGLGLPIAKEIVEHLGGKISIKSIQGLGTTVSLHLSKKS